MLKILIEAFKKSKGRMPNAIEMLQLKFKAAQQSGKGKVIEFPKDRITDWTKPRPTEGKSAGVTDIGKKTQTTKTIDEDKFVADFMANADRVYYRFVSDTLAKVQNASKGEQLKIAKDIINRKGIYHSLDEKDATKILKSIDQNIKPVEPKAYGGLAGMLGERTGFKRGTSKRRPKMLPGPFWGFTPDPTGEKIYQSKEDLPEGILELLQKDPAFDLEEFFETMWAPKGKRWTDPNHPDYGRRGMAGPFGLWSGMAPFGETEMYKFGEKSRGPHDPSVMLTDLDKAKIINHELRHNLMGDPDTPLYHTQPEWVKKYKGPNYLRDESGEDIGTSGHELYNRFIDSRLFPGEEHPGPNAPYFDKILRDHWEPYFQKYKKGVAELKSKPEHLGLAGGGLASMLGEPTYADGGRIGFKGKKFDPSKRTFLKGIAALAALPVVGKYFKWAKPLAKTSKVADLTSVPIGSAEGLPAWFKPLVNKVIKEGDDVTKTFATKEREIVHTKKLDEFDEVTVTQDLDTGNVRVEYQGGSNMGEGSIQLEYKASQEIPLKGKKGSTKTKEEFSAVESEPEIVNWDGDIEWSGENVVSKVDDLLTDTTKLEAYATGKNPNIKKLLESEKKKKYVNKLNEDQMEQVEYIENKRGPFPDPTDFFDEKDLGKDFASGGRVPLAGGLLAKGIGKFSKAEVLEKMFENTIKQSKSANTKKRFTNFIKEIQKNPELANDPQVWGFFTKGLPKNQRLVVHSDDTVDFWRQSEFGPHNIKTTDKFMKKHPHLSRDEAIRIQNMEPEDQILEMKRIETIADRSRTKNASGGRVSLSAGGLAGMLGE